MLRDRPAVLICVCHVVRARVTNHGGARASAREKAIRSPASHMGIFRTYTAAS
jgi:hypothetical protein